MIEKFSQVFSRLGGEKRSAFIPFLSAGDPSFRWSLAFLNGLSEAGADIIELGVPFSDPVADGPVIQKASERSLRAGASLPKVLDLAGSFRRGGGRTPILLFTYLNPLLALGFEAFARRAREAGVQGALVVDLPPEEAAEYRKVMAAHGLETVFLVSPTTSAVRLRAVNAASTGFVYCVSRLGVTGTSDKLAATLRKEISRVRRGVSKPLAVGFGISTPAQARAVAADADGVVVGSALVKLALEAPPAQALRQMKQLARALSRAVHSVGRRR